MTIWNKFVPRRARWTFKLASSQRVEIKPPAKPSTTVPVEIWRRILTFVVRTPGSLALDFPDPFTNSSDPYNHDEFSPQERFSILNLTTVCRTWREVILELMSEYVIIYCLDGLKNVVRRFENSKKASLAAGGHGLGIGRSTRRIDFRLHRKDSDPQNKATADTIIKLFELTPNLEIYMNSNGRNTEQPLQTNSRVMEALARLCGKGLRRVEWNYAECPAWPDLAVFLQGTPNLEAFSLITVYGPHLPVPAGCSIILKQLKQLSLGMPNSAIPYLPHSWSDVLFALAISTDQLPLLTRLDINPFPPPAFFLIHGYKIQSLRTNCGDVLQHLPDALELCPRLRTLVIPSNPEICISEIHPTIECIGIFPIAETTVEVPDRMFDHHVFVPLEETLMLIEGMTLPKLRVVRVRNVGALSGIAERSTTMQAWWRRWNIKGVKFEDKMGTSFEKFVSAEDALLNLVRE